MAAANVSRIGQINQLGAVDAIFLKVFAGEVITTFREVNKMKERHFVRTIKSGKSAQFPAVGTVTAGYHTPGAEILGTPINHAEIVIPIDDLLLASAFVDNLEDAKNHYDVRSIYSGECGAALANTYDKNVLQVGVNAARVAVPFVTGRPVGDKLIHADYGTVADTLVGGIYLGAQRLDENDVPDDGSRYCVLRPAQYYLVVNSSKAINRDFGGGGSFAKGNVFEVAGLEIVKSNHLPSANIAAGPAAYQGDFTSTRGLVYHKSAMGTVQLLDLGMEAGWDMRRQGTLMLAKYAVGHGIVRPESAFELAIE